MLTREQSVIIEEYYRTMYDMMFYYANSVLRNHHLSEEAVQETFRIAAGKFDSFYDSANPNGWLVRALQNVIRNVERSRQVTVKRVLTSVDASNLLIKSSDELSIEVLFGDIADSDDFKLIKRIANDGYTMLEAATELGISVDACKMRVRRAKKRLRAEFDNA